MKKSQLTKKEVIEGIQKENVCFEDLSEQLRDNKDIVLEVVKVDRVALNYASERLKDDYEIVLESVKNYAFSLEYASKRLQDKKELLEILEKENVDDLLYLDTDKMWYRQRMDFLDNLREKELIEKNIILSSKVAKKSKF